MTHSNFEPIFIGPDGPDTEVTGKTAGSKAAMLWRMNRLGLAVPPAFVMPSSLCAPVNSGADFAFHALDQGLRNGIAYLEKVTGRRFGDGRQPLLVSVRSGAERSMPGMLETILDVGLSQEMVHGLIRLTGNPRLAWDSFRRFIQSYSEVVGEKPLPELDRRLADMMREEGARPLPQFNDDGIGDGKRSEATQIGAQGRGHHLGVTAVVLGTGQREAVAEAIHLLRVDGVNLEAALDQRLDHGAVRDLDCDMDLGWYAAARRRQPDRHLGETLAAVPENFLADPAAVLVRQENMMALARPIDASIPSSFINHPRSPLKRTSRRNLRRSLYWRSESGLRVRRGLPTGHRSRPIRRGTRPPQVIGSQGAIGCSRRIGSVWEEYAALDRRPRVTLRSATLHFARPAACIPETA